MRLTSINIQVTPVSCNRNVDKLAITTVETQAQVPQAHRAHSCRSRRAPFPPRELTLPTLHIFRKRTSAPPLTDGGEARRRGPNRSMISKIMHHDTEIIRMSKMSRSTANDRQKTPDRQQNDSKTTEKNREGSRNDTQATLSKNGKLYNKYKYLVKIREFEESNR